MEQYEIVMIQGKNIPNVPLFRPMVGIERIINGNAIPIRGGQGNPFLGLVSGENDFIFTIYGAAEKVENLVATKRVDIYLVYDKSVQLKIDDAIMTYKDNNIYIKTSVFTKIMTK